MLLGCCGTKDRFSLELLCSFVRNRFHIFAWVWFSVLGSVPPIQVSVPPPVPHWLDYLSGTINLNVGKSGSSYFVFLIKIVVTPSSPVPFRARVRMALFMSIKLSMGF